MMLRLRLRSGGVCRTGRRPCMWAADLDFWWELALLIVIVLGALVGDASARGRLECSWYRACCRTPPSRYAAPDESQPAELAVMWCSCVPAAGSADGTIHSNCAADQSMFW
jgi:hypothetical protein